MCTPVYEEFGVISNDLQNPGFRKKLPKPSLPFRFLAPLEKSWGDSRKNNIAPIEPVFGSGGGSSVV